MAEPVALITGSGRGIGAAAARLFAAKGYRVVLTSRTRAELEGVAKTLPPGRCLTVEGDIADESFVRSLFAKTKAEFGRLDVLVNNAAMVALGDFPEVDTATWDRIMAVNVRGVFLCCREAFELFRAQGGPGSIVNISSLGGLQGTAKFKGLAAYSTSKFAVTGLTECLAEEGKPFGIRVNCVAPGAVDTAMLRQAAPFLKTKTTPDDIAVTIYSLGDDRESKGATGSVVAIHSNL